MSDQLATVLVVGDSRLASAILAKGLGNHVKLPTAKSAEQALERLLLDLSIDAMVCDLALPGLSGEGLLARLRRSSSERLRRMPFVALGGNDDPRRALALVTAGASAYIAKPRAYHDLIPTLVASLPAHLRPSPPPSGTDSGTAETASESTTATTMTAVPMQDSGGSQNISGTGSTGVRDDLSAVGSLMRLRWATRANAAAPTDLAPSSAHLAQQIRFAFESHLRSRDQWRPDNDGQGGLLGLTCPIEDSLRPVLRLAAHLNDAAHRLQQALSVAIRLEAVRPAGTIDLHALDLWAQAPELPAAGEMTVLLPSATFRLNLDSVTRGG